MNIRFIFNEDVVFKFHHLTGMFYSTDYID